MTEYNKSGNLAPCKLERSDVEKLINIMSEDDNKANIRISSAIPHNYVDIDEKTPDDFFKHDKLTPTLNNLTIQVSTTNGRIYLTFQEFHIWVSVSGLDQTWVLGKYSQIENFSKEKKPWFWFIMRYPFIFYSFAGGVIGFFLPDISSLKSGNYVYSISLSLFLITWLFIIYLTFTGKILHYTRIIIKPKKSFFNYENITLFILILTLIFTAIGVFK
jgi:hypothetical protein